MEDQVIEELVYLPLHLRYNVQDSLQSSQTDQTAQAKPTEGDPLRIFS